MSSDGSFDGFSQDDREETPSEIWKGFPLDLFDNVFAHCNPHTLKSCRLLCKSLSDLVSKYLFATASCCDTGLYRNKVYQNTIVTSRFFKHVQYLYCHSHRADCLRDWESGHPLSKHINNFVLGGFVDTGIWSYFHIQKANQGSTRLVYTRGQTLPWGRMCKKLRTVYGSSSQLRWKWLESYHNCGSLLWKALEGIAIFDADGVHPISQLERMDISDWSISDMTRAIEGEKAVFPQILPHIRYLSLDDRYQKIKSPRYGLWCLFHPLRLERMDYADQNMTRDLRNLMLSLPGLVELDLRSYSPLWWSMLTWSTDPRFPPLLRGPLQTLKISVDVSYLEQAGKWWRSEVYRNDMGPHGFGTLKHLYLNLQADRSDDPFDPKLILEWLERVIPRECRVHFQDRGPYDPFRRHTVELQEAFDKAFPRGWRLVGPSATATSSDVV